MNDLIWAYMNPYNTGLPMAIWIGQHGCRRPPRGLRQPIRANQQHGSIPKYIDIEEAETAEIEVESGEVTQGSLTGDDFNLVRQWLTSNREVLAKEWLGKIFTHLLPYHLIKLHDSGYPPLDFRPRTSIEAFVAHLGWPMTDYVREVCDHLRSYNHFIACDNDRYWRLQDGIESFCYKVGRLDVDWSMGHLIVGDDEFTRVYCVFAFRSRDARDAVMVRFRRAAHILVPGPG
ncbi:hypothetical protein JL100_010290 [Skermanella mucosa]|uniref:hypothetical protein n=1 Tax=Skermanella mucosa TaxID=1789672 RepID=UPI00192B8A68|nr:hypothetical protein [Skermanella mucosa]UEM23103.1 hypothetical protein JL100_010290 [Skermanella mucosa]